MCVFSRVKDIKLHTQKLHFCVWGFIANLNVTYYNHTKEQEEKLNNTRTEFLFHQN